MAENAVFSIAQANIYANQMLYCPTLPDKVLVGQGTWPEVDEPSRIALSSYTGEPHDEIYVVQTCRREESDLTLAVHFALSQFRRRFEHELESLGDGAKVEWRVKPEIEVAEYDRIVRYHEDGPDKDFVTDKRCTFDRRFWLVKVYARCSFISAKYIAARKAYADNARLISHV
jgi:hypothetical protein